VQIANRYAAWKIVNGAKSEERIGEEEIGINDRNVLLKRPFQKIISLLFNF
jgi:hypothetical protein